MGRTHRGSRLHRYIGDCCNPDGNGGFDCIAVLEHTGPLCTLPQICMSIWKKWLPAWGMESAFAPDFERYSEDFEPVAVAASQGLSRYRSCMALWNSR
ncbi:GyrI-like domain-containing protein [Cupriavidus sp. 8B]